MPPPAAASYVTADRVERGRTRRSCKNCRFTPGRFIMAASIALTGPALLLLLLLLLGFPYVAFFTLIQADYPLQFADWNWLTSVGAFGLGSAQVYFLVRADSRAAQARRGGHGAALGRGTGAGVGGAVTGAVPHLRDAACSGAGDQPPGVAGRLSGKRP